jgi:hypothetical protein
MLPRGDGSGWGGSQLGNSRADEDGAGERAMTRVSNAQS